MKLISKEAAVYRMKEAAEFPYNAVSKNSREALKEAEEILESMPIIEAEPVVHAHWISHDDDGLYHECSNCGVHDYWNTSNVYNMFDYCPDCGAKMDEEVE